jgi:hypothetical protein
MSNFITNNDHFLRRKRNIRNELLNKTDRYILEDYPLSTEQKQIIKEYRQQLREFINNNKDEILKNEKEINFPKQPEFIDLNIIY